MFELDPQDPLLQAAAQQLYVQAINDCLEGDKSAADSKLARLGCRWRLSSGVWSAAATGSPARTSQAASTAATHRQLQSPQSEQQQGPDAEKKSREDAYKPSLVLQHDMLLPEELLQSLQTAFSSNSSDFWQQHNYFAHDTPFFSYIIEIAATSQAGPRNALEAAVLLLQQQLKQLTAATRDNQSSTAAAVATAADAAYVEWWAHTRPVHAPHQLHFDAAEGAFRRGVEGFRLVHPSASSVLYLTAAGGPTVVLDQDVRGACCCQDQQQQQKPEQQQLQQQQQQPEQQQDDNAERMPPSKRSKLAPAAEATHNETGVAAATAAAAAAAGKQHTHHHHHHHHHKHQHSSSQHERAALADCGYLLFPKPGRYCIWPGNRLHGVLPAAAMPLDEPPPPQQQQQQQQQQQPDQPAAASYDDQRTTLIIAWWKEDPRKLVPNIGQEAAAAAAAGRSPLGPCMTMPAEAGSASSSGAARPKWIQTLQSIPPSALQHLITAGAATSSSRADSWHAVPAIRPAWQEISSSTAVLEPGQPMAPAAAIHSSSNAAAVTATAAGGDSHDVCSADDLPGWLLEHPMLACAELPCLRYFLRDEREIRKAYIPDLAVWQQQQQQQQEPTEQQDD